MDKDMNIRTVAGTVKLNLLGPTFPHQKSMAGWETLLLLKLHRAVRFHYKIGQHLECYLGQNIFNSVLMVLRCHPAHRDILHAAEDSNSGQMKICSCSFSKWSLITYHMLDAVLGVWYMWQQLRHGPHSSGVYLPAEEIVCVCVCVCVCVWKTL